MNGWPENRSYKDLREEMDEMLRKLTGELNDITSDINKRSAREVMKAIENENKRSFEFKKIVVGAILCGMGLVFFLFAFMFTIGMIDDTSQKATNQESNIEIIQEKPETGLKKL